jgi:hypothetical protein
VYIALVMEGGFDNNNIDSDFSLFDIGLDVTGLLEVRVVIAVDAIVVDDAVNVVDVVVVDPQTILGANVLKKSCDLRMGHITEIVCPRHASPA